MTPEQITAPGWYFRFDDDAYVRVEAYRFPVYKSGFLKSDRPQDIERYADGLICEGSTYPPDWGQQFIGPLDRPRPCTCNPDDSPPVPCPQKFALAECRAASTRPEALRSSETPRTDAVNASLHQGRYGVDEYAKMCSLARQLERELAGLAAMYRASVKMVEETIPSPQLRSQEKTDG